MNFESVRSIIDTYIKKNGVEAITGDILNNVLNTILDDVDTAISSKEPSPGGGSGEGGVSEEDVLNILEKNNYITSAALSSYYTKGESDARYLASSLLGSNTLIHSGNIGSYKAGGLATPRSIWGQSFDGTSNVDGSFVTSSDSWTMMANSSHEIISYQASGKYLNIGYSTAADNYSTYINGYNIYLRYGANATTGITLNSLGNVLIGTSTDSGYKFDVNGNVRIQTSAIEYFTALRLTNPWYGGSGQKHTDILFESAVGYRGGIIRCTHTAVYGEFDSMNFGWSDGGYADSFNPYMSIQRGGNVAILNTLSVGGNITIQPTATSDVSILFVTGNLNDGYYDYKIGKFTDKNSVSGFGMAMANASAQWTKFLSLSTDGNYNVTSVNILTNLVVSGDVASA